MTTRILLVEDDRKLAPLVRQFLEEHHYEVAWAADGALGWCRFLDFRPDLVVLDLMLPEIDGLTLCRRMRAESDVAILILTARGDETDRVVGLELGADDYLAKPFGLQELLARIRAVLRRYRAVREAGGGEGERRALGPFELDLARRTLTKDGEPIELTRSELDLLEALTRRPGRVLTRDQLLEGIRDGETEALDRAVDGHVSNLRRKIEDDPRSPRFLLTVWGVGYRWVEP
jgi:two-component system phosphate regulon response regulator OmpR